MTSQDNPIYRTITDILGIGGRAKSFEEKVSAVERLTGAKQDYRSVLRSKISDEIIEGSEIAFGKNIDFMYAKLHKAGLVPETAQNVFERVKQVGGQLGYNPSNNALFLYTNGKPLFLPTANQYGGIDIGGRSRKVHNLLVGYAGEGGFQERSFLSTYYTSAEKSIAGQVDAYTGDLRHLSLVRGLSRFTKGKLKAAGTELMPVSNISLSSLMLSGTTSKGMYTPMEAEYSSGLRAALGYSDEALAFNSSLQRYRTATAAFSMLSKTGGRTVFKDLEDMHGSRLDYNQALDLIKQYRSEYIGSALPGFLKHLGVDRTFLYGKADYLGNKKKFLVGSKELGDKYGTLFEAHTATKGMHQMAKIRQEQSFKVAVVDTENELFSRMYFSDGGGLITNQSKFAFDAPVGSLRINSPKDSSAKAIEELFGVNLANGSQLPGTGVSFGLNEVDDVFNTNIRFKDLSERGKNLRRLAFSGNPNNRGVLQALAGRRNLSVGKISMEEGFLQVDLLERNATPSTVENIMGGRRTTGMVPMVNHPLKDLFPGADYILSSDEFAKMHGQSLVISNFKDVVARAKGKRFVEGIFKNITTADEAFYAATDYLNKWKKSDKIADKMLAHSVINGTEMLVNAPGVRGAKMFSMSGGIRTDFMGDINITKPVRMTMSKMKILASSSKLLGYSSAEQDPLYRFFTQGHNNWKKGLIRTRAGSGQLALSQNHTLKALSSALYGRPNIGAQDNVLQIVGNQFFMGGKALDRLPEMSKFSHGSMGVNVKDLSKTILGLNKDMVYIDLGKEKAVEILGEKRNLRYLPVPLKYLRATPGAHDSVVVGKSHPSFDFMQSLIDLEQGKPFDGSAPLAYSKLLKSLPGRDGVFAKTNTILNYLGTRARLAPANSNLFNKESLLNPNNFYKDYITEGDFQDWMTRKSRLGLSAEKQAVQQAVRERGFFYAAVGVDPTQRAEHIMLKKIFVTSGTGNSGFGQVNLMSNPLWLRSVERDTDRDVANIIPTEYYGNDSVLRRAHTEELEKRYATQTKRISPFVNYHYRQLASSAGKKAEGRLAGLVDYAITKPFVTATDYLAEFLGVPKSLGYSMVRSTDQIMSEVISYGLPGASRMGIISNGITEQTIESAIAGFAGDAEKTSVVQQLMQNLYQGAVQKGKGKAGLTELGENLITLGQKYRGKNFNVREVQEEAASYFYNFLENAGNKERSFMALDWMVEKGMLSKTSTSLLLGNLADATAEQISAAEKEFGKAASMLLGEYAGPGAVFAGSVAKQRNTVTSFLQKTVNKNASDKELNDLFRGIAEVEGPKNYSGKFVEASPNESILDKEAAKITKSKTFKKALDAVKDHKFAAGLGVGAVLGAGMVSMMSGPSMPRDIDVRQPVDIGPEPSYPIQPPKIYGTNQAFTASKRRSNLTMGNVKPYSGTRNSINNMIISNKESPYSAGESPYSDYNY